MPEGDTIFRTAASLRRWIGGREVTGAASAVAGVEMASVVGEHVEAVEARAKHLLIGFSGGRTLHTHMRMTGSWHVYPTGERWRKPAHQARVVLDCAGRTAVCFNAPVVELLDGRSLRALPALRRLGPDLLAGDPPDPASLRRLVAGLSAESESVGELLLDQRVVSGIGNIYRCETLFVCRVDPHTPTGQLVAGTLERLVATATRLMSANAASSAIDRDFGAGPGRPWVYGRSGRPCRRCGTTVERELHGRRARPLYWCPGCQRGG